MSRYIDADALINKLDERCDAICQWTKKEREVMCGACPLATAFDVVEDFPPADVVVVVCGEWINNCCSVCGYEPYNPSGMEKFNYCSNCGAKMWKEDEDDIH